MNKLIQSGNLSKFKTYMMEHPFQLFKKEHGYAPLETACIYGDVPIVTYILSLDTRLCYSSQPIYLACEHGHVEVVHLLIKHGAVLDPYVIIPVIQNGDTNMVRTLIHYGINVNYNVGGVSALTTAISINHEPIVRLLLHTPSFNFAHTSALTLWTAFIRGYLEIASLLLATGKFDVKESSMVRDVLLYKPPRVYTAIQMLLMFGCNPNFELSSLEVACRDYDISMVKLLIEFGANPCERSPLISSIIRNNLEMVDLLLKHGANVNTVNINNVPILHLSCSQGHLPMVQLLKERGATITTQTLVYALRGKHLPTIKYILWQGLNEQEFIHMKGDIVASCGCPSLLEFITPIVLMFPLSTLEDAMRYIGNDVYTWERILSPSLKREWPLFIQEANQTSRACYMTLYESPETMARFRRGEEVAFSDAPLRCIMRPYGARPIRNRVVQYLIHPSTLRRLF